MNGLLEILTNKQWMMAPDKLNAIRSVIENNIHGHISPGSFGKRKSFAADYNGVNAQDFLQTEDGDTYGSHAISRIDRPFVNVIVIAGPVTRNGGACSYGSIDHRDMIMAAADNDNCHGHVIYLDTPGGSAWSANDYQQAIEYAREKGQPVYAFIDGCCASAGMYIAAMCDKRFYMHPKDEIGCIGVMAAFYTEKDGSRNEYTNETYHEIYDPESFDKNKLVRDVANEGDTKELVDQLAKLGVEFRSYVSSRCPEVTEEHLHGKVFDAEEVKGILVDEQSTFGEVIALCFENGAPAVTAEPAQPAENRYSNVASACGVESLVVDAEGTHLSVDMLDSLAGCLDESAERIAAATSSQAEAQSLIDRQEEAHIEMIAGLNGEKETLQATIDERDQRIADLEARLAGKESVETRLDEALQTIADRDATIKALTEQPAETPDASPAGNGMGASVPTVGSMPAYDSNLSPMENQKIREDWKRSHNL